MKVGILGAGISGLSLGYFLKQRGIKFEILEKTDTCGGMCQSITDNGFTFDVVGGHIIFSRDKEILDLLTGSLGENIVMNTRDTKVFYRNLFVKYPFENGLSDLPKEENYECLSEFIKTATRTHPSPKNFEEWIYQTFGKGIAEKYMIPYNRKIWNTEPSNMATFWIEGRVPRPPIEDVLKSSLGIGTEGYTHQLHFYYPKHGGFQSLIKVFEEKVREEITKPFDIKDVRKKNGKWVVSNGETEKTYDILVSTIHLAHLADALDGMPEKITETIKSLKYNSLVNVLIGMKGNVSKYHWLYLPDMHIKTHRLNFLKNYSPFTSPQGCSSFMAEITYNEGDEVDEMSNEDLTEEIISRLHSMGLINRDDVCYAKALRTRYAYVVYDTEYEKNIKIIYDFFAATGIHLCGRFSEFKYYNIDACMRSALNIAKKIESENPGGKTNEFKNN